MKILKQGFTLAEISTALAIVGVVAALVIPLVTKSVQTQQSPAVLGRAVEQIELGCQNMMQLGNARRLDGSYSDTLFALSEADIDISANNVSVLDSLSEIVPGYWGLKNENIAAKSVKTIKTYNGEDNDSDNNAVAEGSARYAFTKIPANVAITGSKTVNNAELNSETGYVIYIDTNGWETLPNRTGKDIFAFNLLNNGSLVPASEDTEAGSYAKRVVENGFKIKY